MGSGNSVTAVLSEGEHIITASVSDYAKNTGSSSINLTVVNDAPEVTILAPADSAAFATGSSILFEGSASDTEDGSLTAFLTWTSSIDGIVGTGELFSNVLSDGTHTITAQVTDNNGKTGSSSVTITVGSPSLPAKSVSVNSVSYYTEGGKGGNAHLRVSLLIADSSGNPVGGASVSIDLYRNGALYLSAAGTTGTDGTVIFKVNNAPAGTYVTDVTAVDAIGLSWDGITPDNSYPK